MLLANAALQLQRRRHLAVLGREIARQDRELLDLLEAGVPRVDLVDDALDELLDVVAAGGAPRRELLLLERDQRDDVGPAVADDERLRHVPRKLELVLEIL